MLLETKNFDSLLSFATHLGAMNVAIDRGKKAGLVAALTVLEKDMKKQIGHYQPAVGPHPEWAPLAASTEAEKKRLGAPLGAPLLRHGAMYASIGKTVESSEEGVVGFTDPTMVWHEFGTSKMPPRPVVGPAYVKNADFIARLIGKHVVEGIIDGEITDSEGYFRD